jgi:transposase
MGMGRRKAIQQELFITHDRLPQSPGHVFYERLNRLLADAKFDEHVERLCIPYYQPSGTQGRPSIPPGTYFRMLLIGYFEGLDSQRGIAWRCEDSLSLRKFLGIPLTADTPDHSSLSRIRDRLPLEVHLDVFQFVLRLAQEKKLLAGKRVGVDSTTLQADAAMKSIVRRDTGEDWRAYVTRLMQEAGVIAADETPTDDDIRRFDKRRKDKKVANEEWVSPTDPDAQITRLKDGRTHLAYKAEHTVDLESELILSADIYAGTHSDTQTLCDSVLSAEINAAEINAQAAGGKIAIEEVVADKGYHSGQQLELAQSLQLRTYIPEPQRRGKSHLHEQPLDVQRAVKGNRRRTKTKKNRRLQRLRSERVERSFAHVCDRGGTRRMRLRGFEKVRKRYLVAVLAHNLGLVMRKLWGGGTPRALAATLLAWFTTWLLQPLMRWQLLLRLPPRLQYHTGPRGV